MDVQPSEAAAFRKVVRAGNITEIRTFLVAKPNLVDACDTKGNTPLMLAAEGAGAEVVAGVLLEANADPDACNSSGMTALMWAARHRRMEMVKALLSAGAAEDTKSSSGWRARDLAKMLGHQDVVALLKPPPWLRWLPSTSHEAGEKLCENAPRIL